MCVQANITFDLNGNKQGEGLWKSASLQEGWIHC